MVSRILERLFCWRQPDTCTQVVAALALLPRFLKDLAPATYADFVRADGLGALVGTLRRHPGEGCSIGGAGERGRQTIMIFLARRVYTRVRARRCW